MKGRLDPDFAFYFVFFLEKMVIQNTKKSFPLIVSTYLHNHNVYINNQIMY